MASITIKEMRQAVMDAYPYASMKWRQHIASTRNTRQIVAIYMKLQEKKPAKKDQEQYHQMDMFEYMVAKETVDNQTKIAL